LARTFAAASFSLSSYLSVGLQRLCTAHAIILCRGTANNAAVQKLLHFAVTDVSGNLLQLASSHPGMAAWAAV
jgi:hypothetical protein